MPDCPNCGCFVESTFGRNQGSNLKLGGNFGKKYKCEKCGFGFTKDHLKRVGGF